MPLHTIKKLADSVYGQIHGKMDGTFSHISVDSRNITKPDDTVFFAIEGNNRDGHKFIDELIQKGVKIFVVKKGFQPGENSLTDCSFTTVDDTLSALQSFAAYLRSLFKGEILAVTGSNGKTIVKEWLYQVLREKFSVFRSPRSYNSQVGVPLTMSLLDFSCQVAVIEAGISMPGEMGKLEKIILPVTGIITNIGEAHQEGFTGYKQKLREKLLLFKNCKRLIYCRDQELVHQSVEEFVPEHVERISWGRSREADLVIKEFTKKDHSTIIQLEGYDQVFTIPFSDAAGIENAMHVLVAGITMGVPLQLLQARLAMLEPVEMRMQILKGRNSCTLISDSYNSDIRSLEISLDLLSQQNQHKKSALILSDIFQSGKTATELYSIVSDLIKNKKVHYFTGIGQDIMHHKHLFGETASFFKNTDEFLKSELWNEFHDMAILIKGSRIFEFERITRFMQEKSHQTLLEINLGSLIYNYNSYRSLLNPGTKIMAMVKAFSYGSGGYEIANKLQFHKADYLSVAFTDEGVALRKHGIDLPIMVMNPDPASFWTIAEYKLEPEIYNLRTLGEFIAFADRNGLRDYPVHIKLDTGMHRLGFGEEEINLLLESIPSPFLRIVSVFSHLAAADEEIHDDFTRLQINKFKKMCELIKSKTGRDFIMHILNSAGAERFPEAQFGMVRLGIGLYGVETGGKLKLREVSVFKTHISGIREVPPGESVGYGLKGRYDKARRIATIPVGYADGIPRILGNGVGMFKVNDQLAPVTGNVCMDMCMLDITGISTGEGDEVIIFGPGHSVNLLAKAAATIPYEILTGIPERVKRVYFEE